MQVAEFDYFLPEYLIAQTPAAHRDASRLMVLDPVTRTIKHRYFFELPDFLRPGDCLVLNDTRVYGARLQARKAGSGGRVEILLLKRVAGGRQDDVQEWDVLLRPAKRVPPGTRLVIEGAIDGQVVGVTAAGGRRVRLSAPQLAERLRRHGALPLPPYIHRQPNDPERYQTVFARHEGSVAAPTAGLHFTQELLDRVESRGVAVVYLTLHVGIGTFLPVRTDRVEDHVMHPEWYHIPVNTAEIINRTRQLGGRVLAVGTTVTRALESAADAAGNVRPGDDKTRLFIYPGYQFRVVDMLLTNFHLPKSTLLMLVAAFCGRQVLLSAYREAIRCRYRFYSFGDAMLILRRREAGAAGDKI